VRPLPRLSDVTLQNLRDIYHRCDRYDVYEDARYAKNKNVFIDDDYDFKWIIENILWPIGIQEDEVENLFNEQRCRGINFNIITSGDWVNTHRDYNPTKLNILLTDERSCDIVFVDTNESWDYQTPAILDVSQRHLVSNITQLSKPRIMLQVFLRHEFKYYIELLRDLPNA
jgi:hypothetical protein